jgi:hypothetical protein
VDVKWGKNSELVTTKHHESPRLITSTEAKMVVAPMGTDHSDQEIAALSQLL